MSKAKTKKRAFIEWSLIIGVFIFLNQTSYGTLLQSWFQRGVLMTGLMTPDTTLFEERSIDASYNLRLVGLSDGEQISLDHFRGQTIFMNIWATWCPPCLAEMPLIQDLYEELKSKNIAFVMISTDDSAETARAYFEKKNFTLPAYMLAGPLPELYSSQVLPTTYVISPDGKLVIRHVGMANYNSDSFRTFLLSLSAEPAISRR